MLCFPESPASSTLPAAANDNFYMRLSVNRLSTTAIGTNGALKLNSVNGAYTFDNVLYAYDTVISNKDWDYDLPQGKVMFTQSVLLGLKGLGIIF